MANISADLIYDGKAELAEGPVWHEGALWWVNILEGTLNRLDSHTGINSSRATGDFLGAAVPTARGGWLLARRHQIVNMDWWTGQTDTLVSLDGRRTRLRFNDGNLWVALWDGGAVGCYDGHTGALLERIKLPVKKVSSCCFGGDRLDQLFITTAWEGTTRAQRDAEPLAGGIFVAQPGVHGKAPTLAKFVLQGS